MRQYQGSYSEAGQPDTLSSSSSHRLFHDVSDFNLSSWVGNL